MGERSYLAIGDVLALLREEFPDVTISKIRFLESRGLLDPERTPSGYRKFYESDVDRLRWILRQQREHFLPLKVIKGRLENGMTDPDAPTPHLFEMGDPPPEREAQAVLVGAGQLTEQRAQAALAAVTPIAAATGAADRLASRSGQSMMSKGQAAPTSARAVESGPSGSERAETHETPEAAVGGSPEPHQGAPATESPRRRRASSASSLPPAVPEGAKETGPAAARPPENAQAPSGPGEGAADKRTPQTPPGEPSAVAGSGADQKDAPPVRRGPTRPTTGLPGAGLSGASLTLSELAHASGLEISAVEELESFGLIAGRTVAGVHCYDEEAVLVAKLAARFAPYGIEARHLKVFKHASDRQTGLFAQVVTPLLRQRNPEARARAIEDLSELAELGEALMRCFSQATFRELTGG